MMDSIIFHFDGITIELVDDRIRIWNGIGNANDAPDADLPIEKMRDVMGAANILNFGRKK